MNHFIKVGSSNASTNATCILYTAVTTETAASTPAVSVISHSPPDTTSDNHPDPVTSEAYTVTESPSSRASMPDLTASTYVTTDSLVTSDQLTVTESLGLNEMATRSRGKRIKPNLVTILGIVCGVLAVSLLAVLSVCIALTVIQCQHRHGERIAASSLFT